MIAEIQQYWKDGLSLTQIAKRMNTTVGVIAGRINRARQKGIDLEKRPAAIVRRAANNLASETLNNATARLQSHHCRYILNEDTSNPVYCCEPILRRSYCKWHARLCFEPPAPKRRRRA